MATIEQLVPGLAEQRAREHKNRALDFARLSRRVCGEEIRPVTPRSRLALQLLRNAFAAAVGEPLDGDVFEFIWLHHSARANGRGSRIRQWWIGRRLRARGTAENVREIKEFLLEQLQDMPGSSVGDADGSVDQRPWIHWVAQDAGFWLDVHGGFTLEAYLDTPMLVLQQLHRVWLCNHPEIQRTADGRVTALAPSFVNASDRIVSSFLNERRAAAVAAITAQRHVVQ
jgi:hypothetical protein